MLINSKLSDKNILYMNFKLNRYMFNQKIHVRKRLVFNSKKELLFTTEENTLIFFSALNIEKEIAKRGLHIL